MASSSYTKSRIGKKFTAIWRKNIVLSMGMGLVPVIAASSLRTGIIFSIMMCVLTISTYGMVAFLKIKKPKYLRIPIYALISGIFYILGILVVYAYNPMVILEENLMLYLYIAALDAMVIFRADQFARHNRVSIALLDGIINVIGFAVVILLLSSIREILGNGTIYGIRLFSFTIPGVSRIYFGFFGAGLLAALFNAIGGWQDHLIQKRRDEQDSKDLRKKERAELKAFNTLEAKEKKLKEKEEKQSQRTKADKPKKEKKRKKDVPAAGEQAIDSSIDSGQQGVSAEQAPLLAVQEEDGEGQ